MLSQADVTEVDIPTDDDVMTASEKEE